MQILGNKSTIVEVAPECAFSPRLVPRTGGANRCAHCGFHRFAAVHRPTRAMVDPRTELRSIDELGYEDACSVESRGWRLIGIIESFDRFCSDWDHADVLYRANMRAFVERFSGTDYVEGRAGLLFDAEDTDTANALADTFEHLEDYPVLDDEVLSRLEDEEFWETLTTCFDIPDDVEPEAVAGWLSEHTSCYRADDLSQARVDDAVRHVPHLWRNRFDETADESEADPFDDACRYCGTSLTVHTWFADIAAAEAAGQLPLLPELALAS
jgi:hypothetical protein